MSCSFVSVRLTVAAGEVIGDMLTFILPIVMQFVIILLLATSSAVDDWVDAIVEEAAIFILFCGLGWKK